MIGDRLSTPDKIRVLVVDDEPSNLDVVSRFLKLEGFQVSTAVDGEQALEMVARDAPDLLLLDLILPRLDGYEVCRRLKSDPSTVFLPVVMITALKGTEERIKGVAVGADDFLTKPFNHLELVTRVRSLLRVKFLHDEVEEHNRLLEARVADRTAQLKQALEDLKELDHLKSQFIGNVSHELRTPLLHVKGYVSLLADGGLGPLTEEQAKGLETASAAIDRLERLVEDIVDFGGAEIMRLTIEPVDLKASVDSCLDLLRPTVEKSPAVVRSEIPAELPRVKADPGALARAIRHLLDNAVKFSPDGGEVIVRARLDAAAARVRFSVTDHGIGIPADQHRRIFDLFYQADGSTTRRFGGTGVGLAFVKMIVEGHGSGVDVQSAEGQGSTFSFELPVAEG